jgi:hypothetical protein
MTLPPFDPTFRPGQDGLRGMVQIDNTIGFCYRFVTLTRDAYSMWSNLHQALRAGGKAIFRIECPKNLVIFAFSPRVLAHGYVRRGVVATLDIAGRVS